MNYNYAVLSIQNTLDTSLPRLMLRLAPTSHSALALKVARSITRKEDSYKVKEVHIYRFKEEWEYYPSDYKDPKKTPFVWKAVKNGYPAVWTETFFGDFKDSPETIEISSEEKAAPPGKFRVVLSLVEHLRDRVEVTLYRCGEDKDSERDAVASVSRMDHEHELLVYNDKGDVVYRVDPMTKE